MDDLNTHYNCGHVRVAEYVEHHLKRNGYKIYRTGSCIETDAAEKTVRNCETIALRKGMGPPYRTSVINRSSAFYGMR